MLSESQSCELSDFPITLYLRHRGTGIQRSQCCNLSGGVALIVWFTTNGMCAKNKNIYAWCEQGIIEWSRRVISIVACCHGAKLCAYAARDFRSQQNGAVTRMWRSFGFEGLFCVIVTQQRPRAHQSASKFRNLPLQAKDRTKGSHFWGICP